MGNIQAVWEDNGLSHDSVPTLPSSVPSPTHWCLTVPLILQAQIMGGCTLVSCVGVLVSCGQA